MTNYPHVLVMPSGYRETHGPDKVRITIKYSFDSSSNVILSGEEATHLLNSLRDVLGRIEV